jgi:hypothetical protein
MGEICDRMLEIKPLGLDKSPAKSTSGDGLRERDNAFFKELHFGYC